MNISKIFVQYSEDGEELLVRTPYNKEFLQSLAWNNIIGIWNSQQKIWYFKPKDSESVIKLLEDYFS